MVLKAGPDQNWQK